MTGRHRRGAIVDHGNADHGRAAWTRGHMMHFTGPPARPSGLRRALFRLPIMLYNAGLGGLLGSRFVLINHTGRMTGLPRRAVVEIVERDGEALTVAAGFGSGSDWYRNLLHRPRVTVQIGRRRYRVTASRLPESECGAVMLDYAHQHPRAALRLARFMGFVVDGSDEDYRAMGQALPMMRLAP
jgi:deazaflavin-dependent oxidoreductase (nitroreductase family)